MFKKDSDDQRKKLYTPAGDRVLGYTASEIESIKVALSKKLGPEFISKRKGPGFNSVQYLEGWKAINLANGIFGFNGWNTELKEYKVDYIDDKNGAISMGLSCIVRVILKDGTFHEDVGYGSIDNCRNKSMAFEKCKKEACTDGMKRALRQFGNALGNCLYDKEFLQQITKVPMELNQFDEHALMRRSLTVPKIEKSNDNFNISKTIQNSSYPTKVLDTREMVQSTPVLVNKTSATEKPKLIKRSPSPTRVNKSMAVKPRDLEEDDDEFEDDFEDSYMFSDDLPAELANAEGKVEDEMPSSDFGDDGDEERDGASLNQVNAVSNNSTPKIAAESDISANSTTIPEHVTFVSATSADTIQQDPTLQESLKFDISYTAKNIGRSSLINHSKSLPVKKSVLGNLNKAPTLATTPSVSVANGNDDAGNKESGLLKKPVLSAKLGPIYKSSTPIAAKTNVPNHETTPNTVNPTINPLSMKRSFGLPPDKLQGKRLKK